MRPRKTQGLTLIEVLLSIVIASVLLSTLAGFMAISIVRRSQGSRIVEATALARSTLNEIQDFWRTYDEEGASYFDRQALVFAWNDEYFDSVPETNNYPDYKELRDPTLIAPNSAQIPSELRAIPIDTDGDNNADFLGQVFVGQAPGVPVGELKRVVIRIFEISAPIEDLSATPVVAIKPYINPSGEAAAEQSRTAPLAVLVADLSRPEVPL